MSPQLQCIFGLSKLQTTLTKSIDRQLSVHGISFSEFYLLHCLASSREGAMRRIDLAEQMDMSASGITRALNPMEKLKLVQKEKNPRDARVSLVKLAAPGERSYQEALATVTSTADTLLENLDAAELARLMDLLRKIDKGVK